MNSIFVIVFATTGLIISGYALAVDMPTEGKAKCGTCHAIDKNIFGPSFMAVSEKYKGDKNATSKIANSITTDGSFGWLFGSMPAKGLGAHDSEIQFLSKFIADLAK